MSNVEERKKNFMVRLEESSALLKIRRRAPDFRYEGVNGIGRPHFNRNYVYNNNNSNNSNNNNDDDEDDERDDDSTQQNNEDIDIDDNDDSDEDESGNSSEINDNRSINNINLFWSAHLLEILAGTRDVGSPLNLFRGHEATIIKEIYTLIVQTWKDAVITTVPAYRVGRMNYFVDDSDEVEEGQDYVTVESYNSSASRVKNSRECRVQSVLVEPFETLGHKKSDRPQIAYALCGNVQFPEPKGRNVNMLPFILGQPDTLPSDLSEYYDLIRSCPVQPSEIGKVCYLTVSESFVEASQTQRRGGIHIEAPNAVFKSSAAFAAALEHNWGIGMAFTPDELYGGIFMASNIDNTCKVWDCLIDKSAASTLGGIDHLRQFIGEGTNIPAGKLFWMTDRTPHEAIPQREDGHRQFFRLVTSEISVWYAAHSTPNPLVKLPSHIQVVEENKFE